MQNRLDAIELLMQELAPATPEIAAILPAADRSWTIRFHDGGSLKAEAAAEPARLVLSSPLGRPASEAQLAVCETLLSYNLLWRETGGVKAGLGPDGEATLLFELHADQLPLAELRTVTLNFSTLARVWGTYIESEAGSEPAAPAAAAMPDGDFGLRV